MKLVDEIRAFCDMVSEGLGRLEDDDAKIGYTMSALPRLLTNRDLMVRLMESVVHGEAYPDVRKATLFDNEIILHVDPQRRFSLRLYLWGPGEYSVPHDHNSWGVIGAVSDGYEVINYRRVDDGSREGFAQLVEVDRMVLDAGVTASTLPLDQGIHTTGNSTREVLITLNLYGPALPRGYIQYYDIKNCRVRKLISPRSRKVLLATQALQHLQNFKARRKAIRT